MAKLSLTKTRIQEGVWEGVLLVEGDAEATPSIEVTHLGKTLDAVAVDANPDEANQYFVKVPIPAQYLFDGVQTFVISDAVTGDKLDSFSLVTGEPLEDDIRAEIGLLRAELDMLKSAFRRHCLETT